ncbi:ankyrin repeat domain-containing protein [Congregibacter sp.]|uniref:ankyrin repeat domain-containing protein n=1 Tax=Congregibacter sp. TaxID=2744308 RepID=UPI003F6D573B
MINRVVNPIAGLQKLAAVLLIGSYSASVYSDIDPVTSTIAQQNYPELLPILEAGARADDPAASYRLSALYRLGLGVSRDDEASLRYARRAHVLGDSRGSFMLSILCTRTDCPENSRELLTLAAGNLPSADQRRRAPPIPVLPQQPASMVWMLAHSSTETFPWPTLAPATVTDTDTLGRSAIVKAVETGDLTLLESLFGATAQSIVVPDAAVFTAVDSQSPAILKALLEHGGNPNAINSRGTSALEFAVGRGNRDATRSLVESGADPNASRRSGMSTALAIAIAKGDDVLAGQLVQAGAAQPQRGQESLTSATPEEIGRFPGWTVADIAAWQRQPERLDAILRDQTPIPTPDALGKVLRLAAQSACEECVRLLLEHNARIDSRDGDGRQALHWAASQAEGVETTRLLLSAGADPNARSNSGGSALMNAAQAALSDTAKLLIAAGADPTVTDKNGRSALLYAVISGSENVIASIMDAGGDPCERDSSGRDALIMALQQQNPTMLAELISKSDPAALGSYAWRPIVLMSIAGECHDCLRILLDTGLAKRLLNGAEKENTPLMMASARGEIESVDLLLAHEVNLAQRNSDGNSALMLAARDGHKEVVIRLLEAGADALARNAMRMNARELADAAGHRELAQLIDAYNSDNKSWLRLITG